MSDQTYVVVVQCHIVKQRCSGYLCERALYERTGGFSGYPEELIGKLGLKFGIHHSVRRRRNDGRQANTDHDRTQ